MHRLFLVSDDEDFAQWVEKELIDYGRFVRKVDDFEFFMQQWNTSEAEIIITTEYPIESEESFLKILNQVKTINPLVTFMLIYFREEDSFIETLKEMSVICIPWNDLNFGLMETRLEQSRSIRELQSRAESYPEDIININKEPVYVSSEVEEEKVLPDPIQSESEIVESITYSKLASQEEVEQPENEMILDQIEEKTTAKEIEIENEVKIDLHQDSSEDQSTPNYKLVEESGIDDAALSRRNHTTKRYPKLPSLPKHENKIIYKERIIINEKIIGTVLIAVAGTNRRAGSSHNAIQIARYLSGHSYEVACVELLDTNVNPSVFKFLDDGTKKSKKFDDGFHSDGIDFYQDVNYEKYIKILNAEYQYVVVDLGQIVTNNGRKSKEGRFFKEFFRANISIISTFPAIWDFQFLVNQIDKLLNSSWNKPINILVNLTDEKRYKKFTDSFTKREKRNLQLQFFQNNLIPDPLMLEDDLESILPDILDSVIPSTRKKKRFYLF